MASEELKREFIDRFGYEPEIITVPAGSLDPYRPAIGDVDHMTDKMKIIVKDSLTEEQRVEAIAHELNHFLLESDIRPYASYSHDFFDPLRNALHHPYVIDKLTIHGIPSILHREMQINSLSNIKADILKASDINQLLYYGLQLFDLQNTFKDMAVRVDTIINEIETHDKQKAEILRKCIMHSKTYLGTISPNMSHQEQQRHVEQFVESMGYHKMIVKQM